MRIRIESFIFLTGFLAAYFCLISAASANVCIPDTGNQLTVSGVASDDTLNVREGYTTNFRVLFELPPNARNILFKEVAYKSDDCLLLCRNFLQGAQSLEPIIENNCRKKSKIWYFIENNYGERGWASGKYLREYKAIITQENENIPEKIETEKAKMAMLEAAFFELSENKRILLQEQLLAQGYYNSQVNGAWSKDIEIAISEYFKTNKIRVSSTSGVRKVFENLLNEGLSGDQPSLIEIDEAALPKVPLLTSIQIDELKEISKRKNFNKVKCYMRDVRCNALEIDIWDHAEYFIHLGANKFFILPDDFREELRIYNISWTTEGSMLKLMLLENNEPITITLGEKNLQIAYKDTEFIGIARPEQFIKKVQLIAKKRNDIMQGFIDERDKEKKRLLAQIAAEKAERDRKIREQERINRLNSTFSSLSLDERLAIQSILLETEFYVGRINGEWSIDLVSAIASYIDKYPDFLNVKKIPYEADAINGLLKNILSHKKNVKQMIEEKLRKEKIQREKEAARVARAKAIEERMRKERERQNKERLDFCRKADEPDFWKRRDFLQNKPMSITGVDMSMSPSEMQKILECRGYECSESKNLWGTTFWDCKKDQRNIVLYNDLAIFSCQSTNTCGLEIEAVVENLVSTGKFGGFLEWSPSLEQDLDGNSHLKWCRRGDARDEICVIDNGMAILTGGVSIELNRATLGSDRPSFD